MWTVASYKEQTEENYNIGPMTPRNLVRKKIYRNHITRKKITKQENNKEDNQREDDKVYNNTEIRRKQTILIKIIQKIMRLMTSRKKTTRKKMSI